MVSGKKTLLPISCILNKKGKWILHATHFWEIRKGKWLFDTTPVPCFLQFEQTFFWANPASGKLERESEGCLKPLFLVWCKFKKGKFLGNLREIIKGMRVLHKTLFLVSCKLKRIVHKAFFYLEKVPEINWHSPCWPFPENLKWKWIVVLA